MKTSHLFRLFIAIVALISPASLYADRSTQTPDFDFPKDVSKQASSDLAAALRLGDGQQMIDALVRYGIAEGSISQDNLPNVVGKIETALKQEKRPDFKALLYAMEAAVYNSYSNAYAKVGRKALDNVPPADYSEWGEDDFQRKVDELMAQAVAEKDALRKCPISNYGEILKFNDLGATYQPTLYDFLLSVKKDISNVSKEVIEEQNDYLLQAGYLPAYLYAKSRLLSEQERLKLYDQYKDNEHAGCLLARLEGNADAYKALKEYLRNFPSGIYAHDVADKLANIEMKYVQLSYSNSASSTDSISVSCSVKNVNSFEVRAYQVPDGYLASLSKKGTSEINLKKCRLAATATGRVEHTLPFFSDTTTTVKLSPLPYGQYVLVASFERGNRSTVSNPVGGDVVSVYDLTSFNVACENTEAKLFAVDRTTGEPVKGVSVKGEHISGVTVSDGSFALPKELDSDQKVRISKGNDKYAPATSLRQHSANDAARKSVNVYTDLGIYRPGETIKFAAVLCRLGVTSRTVASGEAVEVTLKDANYKLVEKQKLTSDAFGRIEGQFTIPTDRMNGHWRIGVSGTDGFYGGRYVEVSEYKTPTFAVEFPNVGHNFVANQPVKISGVATTYSGMPIAGTEVKLQLSQQAWSWYWRYRDSGGTVINDTTVTTDANGCFSIEYPAKLFADSVNSSASKYVSDLRRSFSLVAKVTTAAGESREASHAFVIGRYRNILIDDFTHENSKKATLPVTFNSTDDNDKSLLCTYTLTDESGKVVKASSFRTDAREADFSDVASGTYTIMVQLADEPDIKACAEAVIYRRTDKAAPVKDCALWIPEEACVVDAKNVAHVTIGVSANVAHIYYVASSRAGIVKQGWLHYKPGMHDFAVQIPNSPDEYIDINFYNVYKSQVNTRRHSFKSVINKQQLNIKFSSFRDKLVPGAHEKWTMQFVDKNGRPVQSALMLEMYDKALESLGSNKWSLNAPYCYADHYTVRMPYFGYSRYTQASYCDAVNQKTYNVEWPAFNLYNRDFFPQLMLIENAPVFAYGVMKKAAPKAESSVLQEVVTVAENSRVFMGADSALNEDDESAADPLSDVKLREADVKTALWKPMLTSDTNGDLVVEFEAPEFNTTWVLQALAYTNNMVSSSISKEVLTQKPLMVKSSLPRFVRAADKVTLNANVMNATDAASTFNAIVEVFNPRSQKVLASKKIAGNLAAKATEVVGLEFEVPDTLPFVGFRVKAASATFGDGEQVMLPVLSDISPVIESKPFFVDAAAPRIEVKMPEFPLDSRVTLEYCNNPVWYCVTALPTIFDSNYKIATNLAHNLFAEVVAQGVAKSNPLIKSAIEQWNADSADSTLVSMLEKNKDLKIGDLLASPWVSEAERQTLRMSKLIDLFDEAKMATEHKKIVEALQGLQLSDGGFPWYQYPGCKSSLWTTETVLELIGELLHMGYITDDADINAIAKKALSYYDKEMLRCWNEQQKVSKNNYSGFSSYVYIRSLFPEVKMPSDNIKMMKNALSAMTKDWKGLSLGEKAYYAMALNRSGYKQVASRIVESLRQFAIVKPELGMYWDNLQIGWRYIDKVAVTATILEAMHEVGASKDEINQIRKWILLMKQSNDWGSMSLAADAVYAILSTGSQWLEHGDKPVVTIDGKPVEFSHIDEYVGYCRKTIPAHSGATIAIERKEASPAWGAVYWQYRSPMTSVEAKEITEMSVRKEYYIYGADGKMTPAADHQFKMGDKVQVRVVIKTNKDLDFVTLIDQRGACFEPKDQVSGYRYMDGSYFYQETKDAQTNLFFTSLDKGTHVVSYDVYVTAEGSFSAGIATAQCQYAPQLTAHSAGAQIVVK